MQCLLVTCQDDVTKAQEPAGPKVTVPGWDQRRVSDEYHAACRMFCLQEAAEGSQCFE